MQWDKYCEHVTKFWIVNTNQDRNIAACVLGLAEEAGEVSGLFKRLFRGDAPGTINADKLSKELGDVLYYWTMICLMFGLDPQQIMQDNIDKLSDRHRRGVIQGSGDSR